MNILMCQYYWSWNNIICDIYSPKNAYHTLFQDGVNNLSSLPREYYLIKISLKVLIFSWRWLNNILPTNVNLTSRDILNTDSQLCVMKY